MGINRHLMENPSSSTAGRRPYRSSIVNSSASSATFDSVTPTGSYKRGIRHSRRQWARRPVSGNVAKKLFFPLREGSSDVIDLLLLRYEDVEANSVHMSNSQARQLDDMFQLLQDVNARFIKFEQGQACLCEFVQEMSKKRDSIETRISDIYERLDGVESKVSAFDKPREELQAAQELVYTVIKENRRLHERLHDIKD